MTTPPSASLEDLQEELRRLERVVVAFSGGADSAFLAKVAHDTLGPAAVLSATALSPSLAGREEADCRSLAAEWGLRWVGVETTEMQDDAYVANGADRCARCKVALMDALGPVAESEAATVVLGVNVTTWVTTGPVRPPPPRQERPFRWSRPGSPRATSAAGRACLACAPGTSRRRPAWRRGCLTGRP